MPARRCSVRGQSNRGVGAMAIVTLLEPLHPEAEALLADRHVLRRGLDADVVGAAAIVTRGRGPVSAATIRLAGPALQCVARVGSGMEHIDVQAATAAGIPVLNAPDGFTQTTAEHALALLLCVCRRIVPLAAAASRGDWAVRDGPLGLQLAGLRLGVVGLGRIGRRFAEMARAVGMEVAAWSRTSRDANIPHLPLEDLLARSDVVSLHLALTPETRGFLNADRIRAMKPGAVLINVARGALVEEAALADALRRGHLRAAALDVLGVEPPTADHPLLALPQVLVTPHTASLTDQAFRQTSLAVARAVDTWLRGEALDRSLLCNPEVLARWLPCGGEAAIASVFALAADH